MFLLPPLAVLLIGSLLALWAWGLPRAGPAPATDSGGLAPLFTPQVQYWGTAIIRWAAEAGVDPNLAAVVMQIESCGDPRARSRAGALGLFQVMPYHFAALEDPYDPDTNARRGLAYLARSLAKAGGDPRLALAGYNGGISVIGRGEAAWKAETVRYVYWGSEIYQDALQGKTESARLQEWLSRGGASLCAQAGARLNLP